MTTPSTPAAAPADIAQALAALEAVLTEGAAMVRRGDMVDLSGLDRELKGLLDAALLLPPPDARAMLPALDRLLAGLDALEADLRAVHGTAVEPEKASRRIRAAAAYRKPEGA